MKADRISQAQEIPAKFLENIMSDLRNAGLVRSQRGMDGGYWLARGATEITPSCAGDVMRAVDGPPANAARGAASRRRFTTWARAVPLREVWIAVRANLRRVLESVTLADVASGELPPEVAALVGDSDAWLTR